MDGAATILEDTMTRDEAADDTYSPDRGDDSADGMPEAAADEQSGPAGSDRPAPQEIHPHRIVEAILMAADSPLPAAKIASILGVGTARDAKRHIERLNEEYDAAGMSIRIEEIAGGFQILTRPEYNTWLAKLLRVRQETKLSAAAMETLSIVAYKQPCTRADVEAVRGVAAGDMLNRLREMNLVKIVGRAEDLGRPILYGTTKKFLEVFGLPSLEDLPRVEALRSGAATAPPEADASGTSEADQSTAERDAADAAINGEGTDDEEGRNIPFPVQPEAVSNEDEDASDGTDISAAHDDESDDVDETR